MSPLVTGGNSPSLTGGVVAVHGVGAVSRGGRGGLSEVSPVYMTRCAKVTLLWLRCFSVIGTARPPTPVSTSQVSFLRAL